MKAGRQTSYAPLMLDRKLVATASRQPLALGVSLEDGGEP